MLKLANTKALMISVLITALVLAAFFASTVSIQADPFLEIKEKLSGISEEEKEILQNLFTLAQEIELMETEEKKFAQEIEAISQEIKGLEAVIADEEAAYENRKESLKRVLKSYQRMGPGSFVEIVLESESLGEFLQRVNLLRDLTQNTGELLEQLDASREKLSEKKAELSEKLVLIEERRKQSKEALDKKIKLKAEKEEYLLSLKGESEYYQEQLANIEQVWNELKPLVSDVTKEFSHIIGAGNLPTDALKLTFSLFEIRGSIEDKVINKVVSEQSELPNIVFAFHPGKVEISMPEKNLILSGTFIIQEGHTLKFEVREGSFYGMPLEPGSIQELFSEGDLVLNLEPLLSGNDIHALEIKEGYLELISKLDLF